MLFRSKDIKGQFRLFMNGVVSQSMREKGLDYKLNFGIELPRLKEIASRYEKNHEVAQALWKENIRECKILEPKIRFLLSFSFVFYCVKCYCLFSLLSLDAFLWEKLQNRWCFFCLSTFFLSLPPPQYVFPTPF